MLQLAESHILSILPYTPGRPIENSPHIKRWAKLASNENCLGPSPLAVEAVKKSLGLSHLYPNAYRMEVIKKLCQHLQQWSIKPEQVALGNGTSELIVNLVRGLVGKDQAVLFSWPTFIMYGQAASTHGRQRIAVPLKRDMAYDLELMMSEAHDRSGPTVKMIFIANPNNPTGNYISAAELEGFVSGLPKDVILVIDEAYREYVVKADYPDGLHHALLRPRTLVLRTFSKIFGLAGLRLGYAIGDPSIIDVLCRVRDPFNVNSAVQRACMAALDDHEHVRRSIEHNLTFKPTLVNGLKRFGFKVHDGVGNFVMAERSDVMPSIDELSDDLLSRGVIIRPMEPFGLKDYMRISVGTRDDIDLLTEGLEVVLNY